MIKTIPSKIAHEIHLRDVDSVKCNVEYADKLHPEGKYYAVCDHVNNAIRLWLMTTMNEGNKDPSEATLIFMDFLNEAVFPSFFDMPHIKEMTGGGNPISMATADNMKDLIELLGASVESESATKQ